MPGVGVELKRRVVLLDWRRVPERHTVLLVMCCSSLLGFTPDSRFYTLNVDLFVHGTKGSVETRRFKVRGFTPRI